MTRYFKIRVRDKCILPNLRQVLRHFLVLSGKRARTLVLCKRDRTRRTSVLDHPRTHTCVWVQNHKSLWDVSRCETSAVQPYWHSNKCTTAVCYPPTGAPKARACFGVDVSEPCLLSHFDRHVAPRRPAMGERQTGEAAAPGAEQAQQADHERARQPVAAGAQRQPGP